MKHSSLAWASKVAGAERQCEKLLAQASRTTTVLPALEAAAARWLRRMPANSAGTWRGKIADAKAAMGDGIGPRHLTLAEQGDVILGRSACEHRDRKAKDTDGT